MGDGKLESDDAVVDTTEFVPRRSFVQHPAVLLLLVAAIAALMYMAYRASDEANNVSTGESSIQSDTDGASDDNPTDDESNATVDVDSAEGSANHGDSESGATTDADPDEPESASDPSSLNAPGKGAATIPAPEGPYVAGRLNLDASPGNGLFLLTGRVPNQELADQVRNAAELSYGPFVESELEVDESLPPVDWLAVSPRVIGLLPGITDGTLMVVDGKILLSARSPNIQYLQTLQGGLGLLSGGMSVEVVDTVITDLEPPLLIVEAKDDSITLSGRVPSEQVVAHLSGAAASTYGEDKVVNTLTVDQNTYRSFWMEIMPGALQLLRVYPKYNLLVGDGQFSGVIQGGLHFDSDSTEITEATADALNVGVSILARDISIGMTVTGHTDASGPDDYNQALSQARANSVIAYFEAEGIEPTRLVANGAGESVPIGDNTTEEGRSTNRRVEFHFGPVLELER